MDSSTRSGPRPAPPTRWASLPCSRPGSSGPSRSRRHRWIAGVCGGLAEWVGWNPMLVRLLYVIVSIVSVGFPGTIAYIVLWMIMPESEN
ncbi:MAG: PspC domain-containing protein [Chloroflexota bacterium]